MLNGSHHADSRAALQYKIKAITDNITKTLAKIVSKKTNLMVEPP